jgi:NTP pyrophosphatase (non-canonical NTP hydrolase)
MVDAGRESPSGRSASEDSGPAAASGQTWDAARVAELEVLRDRMRKFAHDRDWGQFHDPKSVILALVGEVGELAELFQWLPAADARDLAQRRPLKTRAGEEMADVLLYLVLLADVLDIDLAAVALAKMDDSERRFPPSLIAGTAPERDR